MKYKNSDNALYISEDITANGAIVLNIWQIK